MRRAEAAQGTACAGDSVRRGQRVQVPRGGSAWVREVLLAAE